MISWESNVKVKVPPLLLLHLSETQLFINTPATVTWLESYVFVTQAARKLRGRSFQMGGSERLLSLGDELNFSLFLLWRWNFLFSGAVFSRPLTRAAEELSVSAERMSDRQTHINKCYLERPCTECSLARKLNKSSPSFFLKLGYLQSVSEVGPTVNQPESDNTVQRAHFQSQISVALASADHGSG